MVEERNKLARSEFLFPGSFEAGVMGENHVRLLSRKYAKAAGLPRLKVHEFRHSCASNLIRAGLPLRIVARRLGDTGSTILSFYSHMFPDEENSMPSLFDREPLI